MKELLTKLGVTTGILLYLYVCGSLYLVSYWTTFDLNISNFVTVGEIPRSFLIPLLAAFGFSTLIVVVHSIGTLSLRFHPFDDIFNFKPKSKSKWVYLFTSVDFYIAFFSGVTAALYVDYRYTYFWAAVAGLLTILASYKLSQLSFFEGIAPTPTLRLYVTFLLFGIPFICFLEGKVDSSKIYKNQKIRLIKTHDTIPNMQIQAISDSMSLKLLGFLGEKVILSSLDNQKIYIINQSAFNAIELGSEIDLTKKRK